MKIVIGYATKTVATSSSHNAQIQVPKQDNARWYFSTLLNQFYQITTPISPKVIVSKTTKVWFDVTPPYPDYIYP